MYMARYKYKLPDSETATNGTPTTNIGLADTAEKKKQNYLSGKEAYAADYNQTLANLKTERTHRGLTQTTAAAVVKGQQMEASQLNNLRTATQGLVNYNGKDIFPWSENIAAMSTKLKAKHLEEVRQVVDDSLNNARCVGGCTSTCGRGCGTGCAANVCSTGCGKACQGGCGEACAVRCGEICTTSCSSTCASASVKQAECVGCGKSCINICYGNCGGGCRTGCTDLCSGCSGTCSDMCSGGNCGYSCSGTAS
jgi:hypothetical protein